MSEAGFPAAPPAVLSTDDRLARIERAVAALAQREAAKPAAPPERQLSGATADMLAVMEWGNRQRTSALDEIGKTLQVVQQIQGGKVELEPAGNDWVGALVEALAPHVVPLLAARIGASAPATPVSEVKKPHPSEMPPEKPAEPPAAAPAEGGEPPR